MPSAPSYRAPPYCGVAPSPIDLAHRWNGDAYLIAVLALLLIAYFAWSHRADVLLPKWRQGCFYAGWLVALMVLVSPLCALSVALFSARIAEHMLLVTVSAPLVALGWPAAQWVDRTSGSRRRARPLAAAAGFAVAVWFWHAPGPYAASFASDAVFWCMQITLYGTALWFWAALFDRSGDQLADFVAATFLTTGQMGLLGAIITFAGRPLYAPHLATTLAWGLSPLQDQQLGGVEMWIPAGAIFALALSGAFVEAMRRSDARRARIGPA